MTDSPQSLSEKAAALYKGEALAPMVRASTAPARILALQYGADFVYTEELVDRALSSTIRVENKELQTIDYVKEFSSLPKKTQKRLLKEGGKAPKPPLILRIDRRVEAKKLVCQIGTGEPELALAAALHVKQDVDAFDINMGCPKKFSVSGGMGSALLQDPDRASRIIKNLRDNLPDHPVSCKIRLLKDTQSTVDFITAMVNAGAQAVAIHARRVGDDCINPASWKDLEEVIPLVKAKFPALPVLINGDFYTRKEFTEFQEKHGTSGVLLARPALYNMSIFRKPEANADPATSYSYDSPLLLSKTKVVQDYLEKAVRYDYHHKNVKYVISEMMTNRRTPTWRVIDMPIKFPGGQNIDKCCKCSTLEAMCNLWGVPFSLFNASSSGTEQQAGEHKYDDAYILQGEATATKVASSEKIEKVVDATASDEKKEDEPPAKRSKID